MKALIKEHREDGKIEIESHEVFATARHISGRFGNPPGLIGHPFAEWRCMRDAFDQTNQYFTWFICKSRTIYQRSMLEENSQRPQMGFIDNIRAISFCWESLAQTI